MDAFQRISNHKVGIGGWKCSCCGPKIKDRPRYRRAARRSMKNTDRKAFQTKEAFQTEDT